MRLFTALVLVLQFAQVIAQTSSPDNENMDRVISLLEKNTVKEPTSDKWDVLINAYYKRYENEKRTANALESQEAQNKANEYYNDLIVKCKTAGLQSQSPLASELLRNYFVDKHPDAKVKEEAKNEFFEAEKFFKNKDYSNSKIHYQKALSIQPDYYKATVYLGDIYWYLDKIDSAVYFFKKAMEMQPGMLEPRIYLLDALILTKKYDEAKSQFMDALYVYPDESLFLKFGDLNLKQGIKYNRQWIKRGCDVNNITGNSSKRANNKTWFPYQMAKDEIKDYCDSDGIITKTNSLTSAKYLEVYSWEKMLKETTPVPEELAFAKKMYDAGYLDCYVFISMFQFDLYPQYKDFVVNNKDRIKTYVETYLIEK